MAGDLFNVWGRSRFQAVEPDVPPELEDRTARLLSSEGGDFELSIEAVSLSRRIMQSISAMLPNSPEHLEVRLPLKTKMLGKVVDYLSHHEGAPPKEVVLPLRSESLVDSGTDKWDVNYVNLKKDDLFDLMMAAALLQIPSLIVLTNARATQLVKDKEPSKIRKDFGLKNDFPAEEEEELTEKYIAALDKAGFETATANLHSVAGILAGLAFAAIANDVCEEEFYDASSASLRSYRHFCWHAAILVDWKLLSDAPPEVQNDRELLLAAVGPSGGAALRLAGDELRSDRTLFLSAVGCNPGILSEAAHSLRGDREFVGEALGKNAAALLGASDELRRDPAFVLDALRRHGAIVLSGAAEELAGDGAFVLECVASNPEAARYAHTYLRHSEEFALAALDISARSLQYLPLDLRAKHNVVERAVGRSPEMAAFAHTARRADLRASMPWDGVANNKDKLENERQGFPRRRARTSAAGWRAPGLTIAEMQAEWQQIGKLQKIVQFSAMNTMQANMGQTNYISANSYLDKLPFYERPEVDSITLMWGPVGQIGMRQKAFASQDFLLGAPEALMSIWDARRVLRQTVVGMFPPEWYNPCFQDEYSREQYLKATAGLVPGLTNVRATATDETYFPARSLPKAEVSSEAPRGANIQARESETPLASWPQLGSGASTSAAPVAAPLPLCEGALVQLSGLNNSKNGLTGVAVKQLPPDGKWRVLLHNNMGKALLKASFLQVIPAA